MKSEKATQILLLAAGLVFFLVGIFRGEAAVVLSKAIKLCNTARRTRLLVICVQSGPRRGRTCRSRRR